MKSVGIIALSFTVVALTAAVLVPVFLPPTCPGRITRCSSNMKQIAYAMMMYSDSWDSHFPINCSWTERHKAGPAVSNVKLTPLERDGKGNLVRFRYGLSWVEALYPFTGQLSNPADRRTGWRCPQLSTETSLRDTRATVVSYSFNANVAGYSQAKIRRFSDLMMLREMDRLVNTAELRPMNRSIGDPNTAPISPFLTRSDREMGRTNPNPHVGGSNIVFADGHIQFFSADVFPADRYITKLHCWDPTTMQWRVNLPGKKRDPAGDYVGVERIAITP